MARLLPRLALLLVAALALSACGKSTTSLEQFNTRVVTLPDGTKIRAEVMIEQHDMMRGMMFRKSLAEDRGMLFLHGEPGNFPYWMYQVEIPLDIIWMNQAGRVVEISADTPPCRSQASECPNYGGNEIATVVLELAAGSSARHNVRVGSKLRF